LQKNFIFVASLGALLLIAPLFSGCKDDVLIIPHPALPKPPHQVATWDLVGLNGEFDISAIRIFPDRPWIILVGIASDYSRGTQGKILRSVDWGNSWAVVADSISVSQIILDRLNPSVVYASLNVRNLAQPGILKSDDEGVHWSRFDSALSLSQDDSIDPIAVDPSNSDIVYAGVVGIFGGGLIKTTNAGESWLVLPDTFSGFNPLGGGVTAIAIDPKNSNEIYIGTAGLGNVFKSYDGGKTVSVIYRDTSTITGNITVNPFRSNVVYMGAGPFLQSCDHGITWITRSIPGPQCIIVYKDSVLFVGEHYQGDGGVWQTMDDGSTWELIGLIVNSFTVPIMALDLDRNNGFLYAANGSSAGGIYRYRIK